jgi:uncharacterized membrane protein YhaH (DUF805 family)
MGDISATHLIILYFVFYFFPALLAAIRRHHNQNAIAMLNLLLGWTVIGWVVALVWACTNPYQKGVNC